MKKPNLRHLKDIPEAKREDFAKRFAQKIFDTAHDNTQNLQDAYSTYSVETKFQLFMYNRALLMLMLEEFSDSPMHGAGLMLVIEELMHGFANVFLNAEIDAEEMTTVSAEELNKLWEKS